MHAPQVGPQPYAVTGILRGFGRDPGDHLQPRYLEEDERIRPQGLDHRCRDLDRGSVNVGP
jgi:hypothetical protein